MNRRLWRVVIPSVSDVKFLMSENMTVICFSVWSPSSTLRMSWSPSFSLPQISIKRTGISLPYTALAWLSAEDSLPTAAHSPARWQANCCEKAASIPDLVLNYAVVI
ncbi:hypothetical protein GALL_388820 [mine drainage metagenome]|uniref:Uncharacterized protein n=1 Tax=mine drainage metagenome TaxID=410659 RepID=A0A1J5Q7K0_9ZZZZ